MSPWYGFSFTRVCRLKSMMDSPPPVPRLEEGVEAAVTWGLPSLAGLFTLGYWGTGLAVTSLWPQYQSYC